MVEQAIVEIVRQYLAKLVDVGIPDPQGVLYGSFARGEARSESDIDLLVLSPLFDLEKEEEVLDKLWHMTWRVDSRIEPIAVGLKEFEENDWSPILEIARREGVHIDLPIAGQEERTKRVAEKRTTYGEDKK